jgi:hypothetical protein
MPVEEDSFDMGKKLKKGHNMVRWPRVWKLQTQNGLWQDIIKAKYLIGKSITDVKPRVSGFPSWKAILKMRDIYLVGRDLCTCCCALSFSHA